MKAVFSEHALFEMERRQIERERVERVVENPQQEMPSGKDRTILQSIYLDSWENKEMLLRVIGRRMGNELFVVTAYKTSKISKYWQKEIVG